MNLQHFHPTYMYTHDPLFFFFFKYFFASATDPSPVQAISMGMIARCIADVILLPVTVVKTRFEVSRLQCRPYQWE